MTSTPQGGAERPAPGPRQSRGPKRGFGLVLRRALRWRARRPPRSSSLRRHMLGVVLGSIIPVLLFAAGTTAFLIVEQRRTFERGASERARALLTAVDTELQRSIAVLEALRTSPSLQAGDLVGFRDDARGVLASRPEWLSVSLATRSGQVATSLLWPHGTSANVEERASLDEMFRLQAPVVGTLFRESVTDAHVFAVRVPVRREGQVVYALSAFVKPAAISKLLRSQELPGDWVGVVLDRSQVIVARTVEPATTVGRPASESLRRALAGAPVGFIRGSTIEGWDVYTPYDTSTETGWTVAFGIPADAVEAPLVGSLLVLSTIGLFSILLGLALAWYLSQRTAGRIDTLVKVARSVGLARAPAAVVDEAQPSDIRELEGLKAALSNAVRLITARSEERDRVEASLRRAEAALRVADQRKDHFLAMLGHELRNPLGIVKTAVHLLKMRPATADPELAELREMIERQVVDMTRLIDDLLDVSRIAQGRVQARRRICDLVSIVRETVADHRETFERSRLRLDESLPGEPLWVMGDPTRLSQAVRNLLDNANKYTAAGGTVAVRLVEGPGGEEAILTVADTGVGMEPELLARAFEPFSQADRTIDRSRGGLGLGLPLVKGLVELHGGEVSAYSEGSGRGTKMTVRLPLEPATLPVREPATPPRERGQPRRVLVVEDNRMAAQSLKMFLVEHGHTVAVAHTGRAGVEAAREFQPDVVLCDIGLPEASGYDVARTLRAEADLADVHLIAVTGYGQGTDKQNSRIAGFDRHLTKPVDLDELQDILSGLDAGD